MDKAELRKHMRTLMNEACASGVGRASFSYAACENALTQTEYTRAKTILCYAAMKNELDTSELIRSALSERKRLAFPVCQDEYEMSAYEPLGVDALEISAYGILSPIIERSRYIPPEEIDLVIVPGLAFDPGGSRLGRGAGYYDRYLRKTGALRMAICADIQLIDRVPVEEHDVKMHIIITQTRCIKCVR